MFYTDAAPAPEDPQIHYRRGRHIRLRTRPLGNPEGRRCGVNALLRETRIPPKKKGGGEETYLDNDSSLPYL